MVGIYGDSSGNTHGFLYEGNVFATIDYPGAIGTVACGINGAGQIAGSFNDSTFTTHGFVDSSGSFLALNVPGALVTSACGINDSGIVVGYYYGSDNITHGFMAVPTPEPATFFLMFVSSPALVGLLRHMARSRATPKQTKHPI